MRLKKEVEIIVLDVDYGIAVLRYLVLILILR